MKHTEIQQDKKEQLEQIVIGLETGMYQDVAEARHNFREILADLALQGYYAKEYWNRYKKAVKRITAGILALSLFAPAYAEKPKKIELICQPSIYQNNLVISEYLQKEVEGRKFLIKIDERIVKKNATIEDIKNYRGCNNEK